jgi:thiamine pyrophosphokinase
MKKEKHPQKTLSTCIVVGPMPFSWKVLKTAIKDPKTQIFFVDGGLIHQKKFEKWAPLLLKNAQSIGDGDSSKKVMSIKKLDQNLSDLAFCLKVMKKNKKYEQFLLVGFLGGRLDHQLFNLGEIHHFLQEEKRSLSIHLEDKIEFLPVGLHQRNIHGPFSLGSFTPNKIKIWGDCEYQSKKWLDLPVLSSRGLSNQGFGLVSIETKTPLMVIVS